MIDKSQKNCINYLHEMIKTEEISKSFRRLFSERKKTQR